jgi:hypothetical protein
MKNPVAAFAVVCALVSQSACAPVPPTVSGQTPITVQSPGSSDGAVLAAAVIAGAGLFFLAIAVGSAGALSGGR